MSTSQVCCVIAVGMRAVRGPLAHLNDVLELRLARRDRERRRALDHEGLDQRQEVGALNAAQGVEQLIGIVEVGDDGFDALAVERLAARVALVDDSANGKPFGEEFGDDGIAGPAGRAGDEYFWLGHGSDSPCVA